MGMVGEIWDGFFRKNAASPMEANLRRITDAELVEPPSKETLANVAEATHDAGSRREIMTHLQESFSDIGASQWRRLHGGLVLLDNLLKNGSPKVVSEIGDGLHFDPLQKLSFLERFEHADDPRVRSIIRQKAGTLRKILIARLSSVETSTEEQPPPPESAAPGTGVSPASESGGGNNQNNVVMQNIPCTGFGSESISSDAYNFHGPSTSSSAYVGFGSDSMPPQTGKQEASRPNSKVVLNGMVRIGHRDDTSSESETETTKPISKVAAAKVPGVVTRKPNLLEDSTDSDSSNSRRRRNGQKKNVAKAVEVAPAPPPKPAPPPANLLDCMNNDLPQKVAPGGPEPPVANLLDF